MKVCAIDIGTNSMRRLLCEFDGNSISDKNKVIITTRMGQGVDKEKNLHPDAVRRNLDALKELITGIDSDTKILIFGTSALRDADNRDEFMLPAKEIAGTEVNLLSGADEAQVGFSGVASDYGDERIGIIDVGGGSTELIFGGGDNIYAMKSYNMGCVRMTERYLKHDPPLAEEILELKNEVVAMIGPDIEKYEGYKPYTLVGIGGTASTLATVKMALDTYDSEKVHKSVVTSEEIKKITDKFTRVNTEARKKIVGLSEKRSDIIVAGVTIIATVMDKLGVQELVISDNDNLEGAVIKYLKKL
jgi:exopolyphosphatase/guanosine-5'-triphosphate,3'-diphosphate pyrophosphatase